MGLAGLAAIVVTLPFIFREVQYVTHVVTLILMWAYLGLCWNILGGFGGLTSFGHGLYFGIGAYTTGVLFTRFGISPWMGMIVSAAIVSMACLLLMYPTFRYGLVGTYFSLVTIAFAEASRALINYWNYVGGAQGLLIPLVEGDSLLMYQFSSKRPYYYVILVMTAVAVLITYAIRHSKLGYYLLAIREDEGAAEMTGVPTTRYKFLGMITSAILTAFGGTFYAQYLLYIEPSIFGVNFSISILLGSYIGGLGTISGPVLGALVMTSLREIMRIAFGQAAAGLHLVIYGTVLTLVISFLPGGIISLVNRLLYGSEAA
jgi:branched-chain amino acid transport system permease protein